MTEERVRTASWNGPAERRHNVTNNAACPDWSSHYENAADRLYPGHGPTLTTEQDEAVSAEADAEYRACEGHR